MASTSQGQRDARRSTQQRELTAQSDAAADVCARDGRSLSRPLFDLSCLSTLPFLRTIPHSDDTHEAEPPFSSKHLPGAWPDPNVRTGKQMKPGVDLARWYTLAVIQITSYLLFFCVWMFSLKE